MKQVSFRSSVFLLSGTYRGQRGGEAVKPLLLSWKNSGMNVCISRCGCTVSDPRKGDSSASIGNPAAPLLSHQQLPTLFTFLKTFLIPSCRSLLNHHISSPYHPTRGNSRLSGPTGNRWECGQQGHTSFPTVTPPPPPQMIAEAPDLPLYFTFNRLPRKRAHFSSNFCQKMFLMCNCVDRREWFEC